MNGGNPTVEGVQDHFIGLTRVSPRSPATTGGRRPASFFLLRRALDAGARPRAIVADFAALMLKDDDNPPKPLNYPELATLRDCLDLAWASRDASFFGSLALGKLLPSYRWRFEIRAN